MALYYGKKQISGGRDYKTEHQMEDYSVSFVDDGEGYTDAAAALSEINSGSKFGKLFAAIKGCLMKFLSSISSLSSDLTALQNKATELQNTIVGLQALCENMGQNISINAENISSLNTYLETKMNNNKQLVTWKTYTISIGALESGKNKYDQTTTITLPDGWVVAGLCGFYLEGSCYTDCTITKLNVTDNTIEWSVQNVGPRTTGNLILYVNVLFFNAENNYAT